MTEPTLFEEPTYGRLMYNNIPLLYKEHRELVLIDPSMLTYNSESTVLHSGVLLAAGRAVENEVDLDTHAFEYCLSTYYSRWMAMDATGDSRWFPMRM